jgi:hypothetical protein
MKRIDLKRSVPWSYDRDIVIVGGGPAGCAAAIGAARLGAKVLLIERSGCLGGLATSGFVRGFNPMSDGFRTLVGGFMLEIVEELYRRKALVPEATPEWWTSRSRQWIAFAGEELKLLLDEKLAEAGVEVLFFTSLAATDVDADQKSLKGIFINNIEGLSYVSGRCFVDGTGDALLAVQAGADYYENDDPMPSTLCSLHGGVDWSLSTYDDQQEGLLRAIADGFFKVPDRHLPGALKCTPYSSYMNAGHLFKLNCLTAAGRSMAMTEGRKLIQEYVAFYRKYVPGFANMELLASAEIPGVRAGRQVMGEYVLDYRDYCTRRKFPDQIGVFNNYIDMHVKDNSDEEFQRFCRSTAEIAPGEHFGLPYGITVARGWRNLWVGGRCASSDEAMQAAIRVQPAAMMTGQAAGAAAAISLETACSAAEVDTARLVTELRRQGAYLPQTDLSARLTQSQRKQAS